MLKKHTLDAMADLVHVDMGVLDVVADIVTTSWHFSFWFIDPSIRGSIVHFSISCGLFLVDAVQLVLMKDWWYDTWREC